MENKLKINKILGISAIIAITVMTAAVATTGTESLCRKTCQDASLLCAEVCRDTKILCVQFCLADGGLEADCELSCQPDKDACIGVCGQNEDMCNNQCTDLFTATQACEKDCNDVRRSNDEVCRDAEATCSAACGKDKDCRANCKETKTTCMDSSRQTADSCKAACGVAKDCMSDCHENRLICEEVAREITQACVQVCEPTDTPCVTDNCIDVKDILHRACKTGEDACKTVCTSCGQDADGDLDFCDISLGETAANCCLDCGCDPGYTNPCGTLSCDTSAEANGVCVYTQTTNCDDSLECTKDICDPNSGLCANVPNLYNGCPSGQYCDPGQGCVGIATCTVNCDDGIACTDDVCDPIYGTECINIPNPANCEWGQICDPDQGLCITVDLCGGTVCADDGIACTIEECNPIDGSCLHVPSQNCPGGQYCDPTSGCLSLQTCPDNCDDGVACTQDACNPTTGTCEHLPILLNMCDIGTEICDPVQGCIQTPACPVSCDDGISCTQDTCNTVLGECLSVPNPVLCDMVLGEVCNPTDADADPITGCVDLGLGALTVERAQQEISTKYCGGVNCDDGVVCTVDTCNPQSGSCVNMPNSASCPSGQICDAALGCVSGTAPAEVDIIRSAIETIQNAISSLFT
jgi:hypothetical protein